MAASAKLFDVASRGPMSSARWTMSRSAARAFMAGRGVVLGVGVAIAVALGDAAEGLVLGAGERGAIGW